MHRWWNRQRPEVFIPHVLYGSGHSQVPMDLLEEVYEQEEKSRSRRELQPMIAKGEVFEGARWSSERDSDGPESQVHKGLRMPTSMLFNSCQL